MLKIEQWLIKHNFIDEYYAPTLKGVFLVGVPFFLVVEAFGLTLLFFVLIPFIRWELYLANQYQNWASFIVYWPLIVLVIGVYFIIRRVKK